MNCLFEDNGKEFIQFLIDEGYPKESIAVEYAADSRHRIDVAVLDLDYGTPIQIFELKSVKNPRTIKSGKEQLKEYLKLLGNENIPAYLVFPGEKGFDVIRVNECSLKVDSNKENVDCENDNLGVLNYNGQRLARRVESINGIKRKKEKTIDFFKIACWILAAVLIVLFFLKQLNYIHLDKEDIALIGVAVMLFLAPSAQKLKVLGVEYERAMKKNEKWR